MLPKAPRSCVRIVDTLGLKGDTISTLWSMYIPEFYMDPSGLGVCGSGSWAMTTLRHQSPSGLWEAGMKIWGLRFRLLTGGSKSLRADGSCEDNSKNRRP